MDFNIPTYLLFDWNFNRTCHWKSEEKMIKISITENLDRVDHQKVKQNAPKTRKENGNN